MSRFHHRASNVFDEIVDTFSQAFRYGARTIRRMSTPGLIGAALVLAFIISILPLALVLFAFFLAIKLVACACSGDRHNGQLKEPLQ